MTFISGKKHPLGTTPHVYHHLYASSKKMADAAEVYPFENKSLEGLAIDPTPH